jgi:hypothetical protein
MQLEELIITIQKNIDDDYEYNLYADIDDVEADKILDGGICTGSLTDTLGMIEDSINNINN